MIETWKNQSKIRSTRYYYYNKPHNKLLILGMHALDGLCSTLSVYTYLLPCFECTDSAEVQQLYQFVIYI